MAFTWGPLEWKEVIIVKALVKHRPGPQSWPHEGEWPEAKNMSRHIPTS